MTAAVTAGPFVMGLDFGTESVRAAICDVEGTLVGLAAQPYRTALPRPGWAEQDPREWWSAASTAVPLALRDAGLSPAQITGLSCDATTMTVVCADSDGAPLRPAIMWMDLRAVEQAGRAAESASVARLYNGGGTMPASAEWYPFKAAWLKENDPDVYRRAAYVVDAADWLSHQLTGQWGVNINSAAERMYYNRDHGGWPTDFYDEVGAGDVFEKLPSSIIDLGSTIGLLTPAAASDLGLLPGTPVAQGGGDAWTGQIGLNVLAPGRMALITGSSHVLSGQSATPVHGAGFFGAFTDAVVPGQYTVEGGQASTGSVLRWFRDGFARDVLEQASRTGANPYAVLDERARHVPIGADGVIVNEYFQGNRTPYCDGQARGMIWGLSLHHGPEHVYRAIQEGVCYGTEHIRRVLAQAGHEVTELVACGGVTRSPDWIQMHADVTGLPITLPRVSDATALGTCILAATGAGLFDSVQAAATAMVHTARTLEPDREKNEQYRFFVDRYVEAYPQMRESNHVLTDHVARQQQ